MAHVELTGTRSKANGQCFYRGRWTVKNKRKSETLYHTTGKGEAELYAGFKQLTEQFAELLKGNEWVNENPTEWGNEALAKILATHRYWLCSKASRSIKKSPPTLTTIPIPTTNGSSPSG